MEAASMRATCRSLPTKPKFEVALGTSRLQFLAPTIFQNLSLFAATAVAPMTDLSPCHEIFTRGRYLCCWPCQFGIFGCRGRFAEDHCAGLRGKRHLQALLRIGNQ